MSISLMTEVWKLQGLSSTQKLVALSLADNANDQGECYPSVAQIVHRTCLSERAVQTAIRSLADMGYVKTLARLGTSTVYRLDFSGAPPAPASVNPRSSRTPARRAPPAADAPPAGNAPSQEVHPAPAADAPPPPQEVHPGGAAGAPKPSVNRQLNRQGTVKVVRPPDGLPDWLEPEVWEMFDRFRRKKDGKAWTEDAQRLTVRDLAKLREQGFDPGLVVEQSVQRGWTGVFPLRGEFLDRQRQQHSGAHKHGNFDQQDYRAGIDADGRF